MWISVTNRIPEIHSVFSFLIVTLNDNASGFNRETVQKGGSQQALTILCQRSLSSHMVKPVNY